MVLSAGSVAGAASLLRETISLKLASGPARPGSARPSHDEPGDDSNIGPKLQGPGRDCTQTSLSCRIPSFANSRRPAAPLSASRRKGMEHRLNPQALRALTLLIAESAPAGTDLIIRLIVNFAASSSGHASALKSTPKTDWPHCAHETLVQTQLPDLVRACLARTDAQILDYEDLREWMKLNGFRERLD